MQDVVIKGMLGLGDNIYQYPVIKELSKHCRVHLKTPWPQIYSDLNIRCVPTETRLRTQAKNEAASSKFFTSHDQVTVEKRLSYVSHQHRGISLWQGLCASARVPTSKYFLQIGQPARTRCDYAVIRPPTIRKEWAAPSRNPRPDYIQFCVDWLNAAGIKTQVVADINPPHEVYDGPRIEKAATYLEHGELGVVELMSLIRDAKVVVGGVGFIAPMCIALGTPVLIVHGGAGGWNGPRMIDAPGVGKLTHVLPKNYCRCQSHNHACDKSIDTKLLEARLQELTK